MYKQIKIFKNILWNHNWLLSGSPQYKPDIDRILLLNSYKNSLQSF